MRHRWRVGSGFATTESRPSRERQLGSYLLVDALARIVRVSSEIGIHAVEVIATDGRARGFYERFGFVRLADDRNHLYLPLSVVRRSGLA